MAPAKRGPSQAGAPGGDPPATAPPVGGQQTVRPAAPEQEEPAGPPPGAAGQVPAAGEDEQEPSRGTGAFLYAVLLLVPVGLFLAPLATFIVWRMRRREPFVDFHGRQSLDLVLGAMVGAAVHMAGRYLDGAVGIGLQWAGLVLMALQGLLVLWGMVEAGRGRMRHLPLSLPLLRWTQRRGPASATHG